MLGEGASFELHERRDVCWSHYPQAITHGGVREIMGDAEVSNIWNSALTQWPQKLSGDGVNVLYQLIYTH
jgi:hypothetical protein